MLMSMTALNILLSKTILPSRRCPGRALVRFHFSMLSVLRISLDNRIFLYFRFRIDFHILENTMQKKRLLSTILRLFDQNHLKIIWNCLWRFREILHVSALCDPSAYASQELHISFDYVYPLETYTLTSMWGNIGIIQTWMSVYFRLECRFQ